MLVMYLVLLAPPESAMHSGAKNSARTSILLDSVVMSYQRLRTASNTPSMTIRDMLWYEEYPMLQDQDLRGSWELSQDLGWS